MCIIRCEDMYLHVMHLRMRSCIGMRACAYPIIFKSHLRKTSVACHLQRMRVADIKGEDQ